MSLTEIEHLARNATRCRDCFDRCGLTPAPIDIAQPRFVGDRYWHAPRKICVLMLNPGAGSRRQIGTLDETTSMLRRFRDGEVSLKNVFDIQRSDLRNWGRGRFWNYYVERIGLDVESTAFVNVAWCATSGNQYPRRMRDHCFDRHTGAWLKQLAPDVVILSGRSVLDHLHGIKDAVPDACILPTLHFAHRKGVEAQKRAVYDIRTTLGLR